MLENAKFIKNDNIIVEDRDTWRNMGFNDRTKILPDKGGIVNFRKICNVVNKVKKATVCATALGIFELYINDRRVGDDELKPGWTDYSNRVFAFTYDITDLLLQGDNMIVAETSCGWWSCRISFGIYGFKVPAFCCEMNIEYENGEKQTIVTDTSWQTAICGCVRNADIWDGEYYDARVKRGIDGEWETPTVFDYEGFVTQPVGERIVVKKHLEKRPVSATVYKGTKKNGSTFGEINIVSQKTGADCEHIMLKKGENLIVDMERNIVGRPHIYVKANEGTVITAYFAEFLNDSGEEQRGNDYAKGSCYIKNYRSALSRMVYTACGEGMEDYAPKHTFFGYRYLEFEATDDVEFFAIHGEVVGSDIKETAFFECSDSDVNKLWSNIVWGQRGNYLSIPTDCPQRDERLGWTGDTHIFCGAGSYIADTCEFMRKWLQDARDTQETDGAYCDVIPKVFKNPNFIGNAAWTDAGVIVPYRIYLQFGDKSVISEHWDSMEKYMNYLSKNGYDGGGISYGDWLCYEKTDKRYIAVSYYAYTAHIMARCASILGKTDRKEYYDSLYGKIMAYFTEKYFVNNDLAEKTQTGILLALKFDLIPHEYREFYIDLLADKIKDNDYTLSTGFVGTGILCTTLHELGMYDLCYDLLLQTKDPSWLYSVKQGATTVWERWNSYTIEKGFGDVNMNSFNHYAYGAVAEWLMNGMCGICVDEDNAGFEKAHIAPKPDRRKFLPCGQKRITHAKATYMSRCGLYESEWNISDKTITYDIMMPVSGVIEIDKYASDLVIIDGIHTENSGNTVRLETAAGKHHIDVISIG